MTLEGKSHAIIAALVVGDATEGGVVDIVSVDDAANVEDATAIVLVAPIETVEEAVAILVTVCGIRS
jgi:menaquinone-dependent protoporphyrinogen IX oxidase